MLNKKLKSMFAVALSVSMVTSSMTTGNVASAATKPKKITITNVKGNTLKMTKGKKFTLKCKITPSKASKKVKFKTSNAKIAKVTTKGKITAVKKGTAKITVTCKANSKVKKTITVKVSNPVVKKTTKPKATTKPKVTATARVSATPVVTQNVATQNPATPVVTQNPATQNPAIPVVTQNPATPVVTQTVTTQNPVGTETPTVAATPTPVVTATPGVTVGNKALKLDTATINGDLTVMVKASCVDGTKLDSFSPTAVKSALEGSKLNLTNGKVTLVANYQNYSYDNDCVTYVLDDASKAKLQPSKNGGDVGSADGEYTISSTAFSGEVKASYYETLAGNYLTGYVYDTSLGTPLKGAMITASTSDSSKSATTDENGFYKIPLSSATYKIKCKTDKYFDMESTAKISNNNGTACNFNVKEYDEEKLMMYGRVVDAESGKPVSGANATIYQIDKAGKEKMVAVLSTSTEGYFLAKNLKAHTTVEYAALSKTVGTTGKTFYNNPLSNDYTYKVVISKGMAQDNYSTIESKTLEGISFSSGMVKDLGVTKVTPVKEVKELKVNVSLPIELQRALTSKEKMILSLYEKSMEDDFAKFVGSTTVQVDADTKIIDVLKDTKMFSQSPTIPNNTYYFILSYEDYASGNIPFKVLDAVAEVPTLDLQKAKDVTINSTFNIINEKAVEKKPADNIVEVFENELGKSSGTDCEVTYEVYEVVDGQKVYLRKVGENPKFGENNTVKLTAALTASGYHGLIPGKNYAIECKSDQVCVDNKEVQFTLEDAVSVNVDYNVGAGASIKYLTVKNASLFENPDFQIKLDYVKVLDSNGKEVGCSDFRELNDSEAASEGVSLPDKGWAGKVKIILPDYSEGMSGLKPSNLKAGTGNYKVVVKFAGYQEVEKEVSLLDFQECTVTLDEKIKKEELTGFTGTITLDGNDIQDSDATTTDASVILYKGKEVVGATAYGYSATGTTSTKYKLENGINADLEDGNYTLVVRCSKDAKLQFDTVAKEVKVVNGKLVNENIEVNEGNISSTTLGITDTNNKQLVNPMVCLIDSYVGVPDDLKINEKAAKEYNDMMNAYPGMCGFYYMTAEKNLVEFSRMENMSKGNYSVWVNSNDTTLIKVHEFTLGSAAHYTKADLKVDVNKYDATVPVTVEYTHSKDLTLGFFDVATLEDANGKIVDRKVIFSPATKAGDVTSVVLKAPNVSGTYKVVIYSTGSFTSTDNVVVQGVSKSVKVVLTEAGLK